MALAFLNSKSLGIVSMRKSHFHSYIEKVTPPTCTEKGYTTYICSCGNTKKDNFVDALGHDYGDDYEYNEQGHWHICNRCGEASNVEAHIPDRNEATNTDPIKCTVCGYIIQEALCSHEWGEWILTKQETCTSSGSWSRTCLLCGAVESKTIKPHGHQISSTITKYATCSTEGEKLYKCDLCDYSYTEAIPTLEHKMNSTVNKHATCVSEGERYYWCSSCDYNYTEKIPVTGQHVSTPVGAVASTCTTKGSTAGEKCAVCDTFLVEPSILPLAPHTLSEWKRSDMSHWQDCLVCGESGINNNTCDRDGFGGFVSPATCTKNAVRWITCSVCGREYPSSKEVPDSALGHLPQTTIKQQSVIAHNVKTICLRCHEILKDQNEPHTWIVSANGKKKTCKDCGLVTNNEGGETPLG